MKIGDLNYRNTRKSGVMFLFKTLMVFVALFLGVGLSYAYFTARATDQANITFANINVDFMDSTGNVYTTSIFSQNQLTQKIQPGSIVEINEIQVKNTGEYDIYAIYKLTINIFKSASTEANLSYTYWYNLDGTKLSGLETSTTDKATLLAKSAMKPTSLSAQIPYELNNDYVKGSATFDLDVYSIQALLDENSSLADEIVACQLIMKTLDQEVIENTVYINPNGGVYNNSTSTQTISQNRGTTLSIATPTRQGYTFKGWAFNGDGSFANNTYTFGKSVATLFANWEVNSYTLSFDYDNGANPNLFDESTLLEHGGVKLTDGTIYVENVNTPYGQIVYKNTNNYQGQISYSCYGRFIKNEDHSPLLLLATYTDNTTQYMSLCSESDELVYYSGTTNSSKIVDKITFTYGSGVNSSYVKNLKIEESSQPTAYTAPVKSVEYDSTYGTLPTPTKEGYTFAGWLGATTVPDLSMWTLTNGATYDETTGIVNLPNENSSIYSPMIAVNGITSLFVKTLVYSESADAKCHIDANYYESLNASSYSSNGSARKFSDFKVSANSWGYITHGFNNNEQILSGTCNYVRIFIQRSSRYATQNYSVRNVQISSTSFDFENTYVTSSTEMTTAANHALVAEWIPNNVILDANGGTMTGASSKYLVKGETYGALPTPTREGYTFAGWQVKRKFKSGTNMTLSSDKYSASSGSENTDTYATISFNIENEKTYLVTFNATVSSDTAWKYYINNNSGLQVYLKNGYNIFMFTSKENRDIAVWDDGYPRDPSTPFTITDFTINELGQSITSSTVFDSTESVTLLATWIKN